MKNTYNMLSTVILVAALCSPAIVTADVAVVVNAANSTGSLSLKQVGNIFLGKTLAFPDGEKVVPMDQAVGNPDRDIFISKVLNKSEAQFKAYWARLVFTGGGSPPKEVFDADEVLDLVSKNPNLIGYVDASAVDNRVKVVLTVQ